VPPRWHVAAVRTFAVPFARPRRVITRRALLVRPERIRLPPVTTAPLGRFCKHGRHRPSPKVTVQGLSRPSRGLVTLPRRNGPLRLGIHQCPVFRESESRPRVRGSSERQTSSTAPSGRGFSFAGPASIRDGAFPRRSRSSCHYSTIIAAERHPARSDQVFLGPRFNSTAFKARPSRWAFLCCRRKSPSTRSCGRGPGGGKISLYENMEW
jgi:hypothetical protein